MTAAIVQAVSAALFHFVWQGALVASLLWMVLLILRNRSANLRYLASTVALAAMAVLPIVTASLLYTGPHAVSLSGKVASAAVEPVAALGGSVAPATAWLSVVQAWAVPAWSLGVLLFSLRLVWGCRQVSSLRRRGEPAEASLRAMVERLAGRLAVIRPVRVLTISEADSPSVMGWLRPVILLPSATLLGLTMPQLEAVLAHELAHIRRHDYLANMLQMLVETILFYHPAIWWTSGRIRHERELCCDDLAVRACGDALCYARALSKLERLRVASPAMAIAGTGGSLLYRIQRLVGGSREGYGPGKLPGVLALVLGLACFGLNIRWAHGQEPAEKHLEPGRYLFLSTRSNARDAAGVNVDLGGAAVLHRTSVMYPEAAIEHGMEGMVMLEATLDGEGDVTDARVISGPAGLRKGALAALLDWHFVPEAGVSIRQVTIGYRLAAATERRHEEPAFLRSTAAEAGSFPEPAEPMERRREVNAAAESGELNIGVANTTHRTEFVKGRLKRIEILGLPEPVQQQLGAQLPVRIGEILTPALMEAVTAAVRKFDIHLSCEVFPGDDGEMTIAVKAPNTSFNVVFTAK